MFFIQICFSIINIVFNLTYYGAIFFQCEVGRKLKEGLQNSSIHKNTRNAKRVGKRFVSKNELKKNSCHFLLIFIYWYYLLMFNHFFGCFLFNSKMFAKSISLFILQMGTFYFDVHNSFGQVGE